MSKSRNLNEFSTSITQIHFKQKYPIQRIGQLKQSQSINNLRANKLIRKLPFVVNNLIDKNYKSRLFINKITNEENLMIKKKLEEYEKFCIKRYFIQQSLEKQ